MEKTTTITDFIQNVRTSAGYRCQIAFIKELPRVEPVYREPGSPIPPVIRQALEGMGISSFYSHQAQALDLISEGKNTAIVTSTASGKTICYTVPVIEALLADRDATALFLFPTKALAQDQLRGLGHFVEHLPEHLPGLGGVVRAGT